VSILPLPSLLPLISLVTLTACSTSSSSKTDSGAAEDSASDAGDDSATDDDGEDDSGATGGDDSAVGNNVLIVIADDMGLDSSPCYGIEPGDIRAPTLTALCARGLRFERAWATPTCSPTRATTLTGTYSLDHGVTQPISQAITGLPADSVTLAAVAASAGVATGSIGKWHLGDEVGAGSGAPNEFGWQHFSGLFGGGVDSYWSWRRTINGVDTVETTYTTTKMVDDAIEWVDLQDTRWLLWLAFNAPHEPMHVPPEDLHTDDTLGEPGDCPEGRDRECYVAAIEALDAELGRLLAHLDDGRLDDTVVIFIGDNGTPAQAVAPPVTRRRAKGTVYEGGIRVPLVFAGPGIAQDASTRRLTDTTDLLPTMLAVLEVEAPDGDRPGASLLPTLVDPTVETGRDTVYSMVSTDEIRSGEGEAIADARWKLIRWADGTESLYDLDADAWEDTDLLPAATDEATEAWTRLSASLDAMHE
jgi:arylsulfatase B